MKKTKLTISIPYKKRLENLNIVLEALANQTMKKSEFEVIVGAMEYSEEYITLCKKYLKNLNITSVVSGKDFSIPRARNLAMRQATSHVIVQMDADTLLPPTALQNLYDQHFAFEQNICVVGQVVGYGNNNDDDVEQITHQPYSHYHEALVSLGKTKDSPRDPRFQVDHIIPWAFGWTGFIALPLSLVHQRGLYFDEEFHGWGVDDLEWSYRICQNEIPIVLCEDVYAIHLPHTRNTSANRETEKENYQRFLTKWPRPDVELAHAFGDVKANSLFLDFTQERLKIFDNTQSTPGCIHGIARGKSVIILGAAFDTKHQLINTEILHIFDQHSRITQLPLAGIGLPYADKTIEECRILPSISRFSPQYLEQIHKEAGRVAKKVVQLN